MACIFQRVPATGLCKVPCTLHSVLSVFSNLNLITETLMTNPQKLTFSFNDYRFQRAAILELEKFFVC